MNHHDMMVNDINAMLDKAEPPFSAADYCIYKVPNRVRRLNDDAYTPKVISIGPFHHRHHHHPHLQNMERHKLIYFKAFLKRAETTTQPLIECIESIIPKFRRCYSETLDFTDQELVKLILIDSGFIIELFYGYYYEQDDFYLLKPWLRCNIRLDLLLFENQLPFFVVEKIFNISFHAKRYIRSFRQLTFYYFKEYNKSNLVYDDRNISISHFTDLIRIFHLQPFGKRPPRSEQLVKHLHSVTDLFEAGVRFKVNTQSESFLDLRFSSGVLEIPQLIVDDWTEILFRNMVALEQCDYPDESYITDYVALLDFLINTGRDVDILVQNEILVDWLGDSGSVANMFNNLCKNVTFSSSSSDYFVLSEDLDGFYSDPLHKLKATLRRDYCSNPWQTAATVAGSVANISLFCHASCTTVE
ncbi:UPF0481 protein At3g47200-like [Vicia villosa]|uniref:UPF0481 protein At3g47200-like n=1 Tax=Vicia villosa TaxID=3911 RepID=UPI00273C6FDA|nr:UPF0481 protein At3g47200-like [Vicia villosa]